MSGAGDAGNWSVALAGRRASPDSSMVERYAALAGGPGSIPGRGVLAIFFRIRRLLCSFHFELYILSSRLFVIL